MIVSTILLSTNNCYVDRQGKLPERPSFDKELLTTICSGQVVSKVGYKMLPPSIKDKVIMTEQVEPEVGITISEIDGLTDLLLVVRSKQECLGGKEFRFTNFECIIKDTQIEIWKRKRS